MNELVIQVKNLSKSYRLYDKSIDRLKESLHPLRKKYYKDYYALSDINFEVKKGETLGIIGKNGCGKSTLLKIITGVLSSTGGNVNVIGKISALLELGAGFNPEMTGLENVYMNGLIMGYSQNEMKRRLPNICDFADIGDFVSQPVKTYSSGMFVRLAFALAINVEPDILIVDEALSVGDINFQAKCMSKINELKNKGVTILFVTHSINTVKTLCSECLYLKNGMNNGYGKANEVADLYLSDLIEEFNHENTKVDHYLDNISDFAEMNNYQENGDIQLKRSKEFDNLVKTFRKGTSEARVTYVEILDKSGEARRTFNFNDEVAIRIHIDIIQDIEIVVCYHIRDDKNLEIIGSDTFLENTGIIKAKKGEGLIVDFLTKVPLVEGIYNLSILLSIPVVLNRTAVFVDFIENANIFEILERSEAKLWDKVYIKNEVVVHRV